ncbi:MAG: hypothetical protein IPJ20_02805 [Flammeovirgaceae bacterium]|nr:hypothetical protein [Flammeovirgaceae bacterium]
MKTTKIITGLFLAGLFSFALSSCENNETVQPQQDLLPQNFSVDIPASLSNKNSVSVEESQAELKKTRCRVTTSIYTSRLLR